MAGMLTTLVYLQLCPEAQGSHPHFPRASNEKQKPGPQTLQRERTKKFTPQLGRKELEIRAVTLSTQRLKNSETVVMTTDLAEKALRKFNTRSWLNRNHHFKLEING